MEQDDSNIPYRTFDDVDAPHCFGIQELLDQLPADARARLNSLFQQAWSAELIKNVEEAAQHLNSLVEVSLSGGEFNYESRIKNRADHVLMCLGFIVAALKNGELDEIERQLRKF